MRFYSRPVLACFIAVLALVILSGVPTAAQAQEERAAAPTSISGQQLAGILDQAKGERTALFLYTSWCPYCRRALPELVKIAQEQPGRIVAVSLDKDDDTLMRYLNKTYESLPFAPYVWDRSDIFARPLARFGIKPGRGIPFTALLDEYGYVHEQGVLEPSAVKAYLDGGASQ